MDQEISDKFEEQNKKLEEIFQSAEKTRKYFLWMLIGGIALVVLPLIGIILLIPQFLSIYSSQNLGF